MLIGSERRAAVPESGETEAKDEGERSGCAWKSKERKERGGTNLKGGGWGKGKGREGGKGQGKGGERK